MNNAQRQRRHLITAMLASGFYPWQSVLGENELLPVTPSDTEGPFYPIDLPKDSDNDLLHVQGMDGVSPGQFAYVHGTVVDRLGAPIDGARVEIWQCDKDGVYHHPGDSGRPDKRFQGFGAMVTDRAGTYHFRTLRPVPYDNRTPHIHYRVIAPGFGRLTTQLYVAEYADRNARDSLYNRHTPEERALLTAAFLPSKGSSVAAEFNIVLG